MLEGLSAEEQLCCMLCRRRLSEGLRESARRLAQTCVNWDRFISLALRHRIVALIHHQVAEALWDSVPPEPFTRLQAHAVANTKKAEAMTEELMAILERLAEAGICTVPLKGPVLIERVWGDRRLGVYHDLDLLVKPDDVRPAVEVLQQRGYRRRENGFSGLPARSQDANCLVLIREHGAGFPLIIDLHHTRVEDEWIGRVGNANGFWDRLQMGEFAGAPIRLLPDDWNLALLALHTLQHWFRSLHWAAELYGLAELCAPSWPEALRRAKEIGALHEVVLARRVCEMILGETPATGERVPRLMVRLAVSPFKSSSSRLLQRQLQLAVREGVWKKTAYLLSVPFVAVRGTATVYPGPSWLKPAYYVLRAFRLTGRYVLGRPVKTIWNSGRTLFRSAGESRTKHGM